MHVQAACNFGGLHCGYRLADPGPHPNDIHAKWGRRVRQLEPDRETAPTIRWIFAQRLTGHSIASELNDIDLRARRAQIRPEPAPDRHGRADRRSDPGRPALNPIMIDGGDATQQTREMCQVVPKLGGLVR
jgi:hypothetical protein